MCSEQSVAEVVPAGRGGGAHVRSAAAGTGGSRPGRWWHSSQGPSSAGKGTAGSSSVGRRGRPAGKQIRPAREADPPGLGSRAGRSEREERSGVDLGHDLVGYVEV